MADKLHHYEGKQIRVTYDLQRCIHAERCVASQPKAFVKDRRPWIDPDEASPQEIADAVCACPTGALRYELIGDVTSERPDAVNSIVVSADGPLYFRGDIRMIDTVTEEVVGSDTRMAMCRCGQSKNKPYCDDTHFECEFKDAGRVGEGPHGQPPEGPGELHVEPLTNGPLFILGPFELRSADGTTVCRGNKTALCRCGHSQNKPFCDGSHKDVGFQA